MAPKIGRPTANPKGKIVQIRVTDKQKEMLEECKERLKVTQTDVLIKGLEMVHDELKKGK